MWGYLKYSGLCCLKYQHISLSHHPPAIAGIVQIKKKRRSQSFHWNQRTPCMLFIGYHIWDPVRYHGAGLHMGFAFTSLIVINCTDLTGRVVKRWSFFHNKHSTIVNHSNAKNFECDLIEIKESQLNINWNALLFYCFFFSFIFSALWKIL